MRKLLCCLLCSLICLMCACRPIRMYPPLPETFGQEFQNRFAKEYCRAELNLMYVSASGWDTRITISAEQSHEYSTQDYYLSRIRNIEDNQYVAVIDETALLYGEMEYKLSIYTHGMMESKLTTWSIKSVSVLALPTRDFTRITLFGDDDKKRAREFSMNPLEYHLNHGAVALNEFENEQYAEEFASLKDAYKNAELFNRYDAMDLIADNESLNVDSMNCFIVIRFEETDDFIWVAKLYQIDENLYFDCSNYADKETYHLAQIESTLEQEIYSCIAQYTAYTE